MGNPIYLLFAAGVTAFGSISVIIWAFSTISRMPMLGG